MKGSVYTNRAPQPIGPYSQAIIAGGFIFISGQIPLDPATGRLVEGGFKDKVRAVMDNIKSIIEAAGGSMDDLVKVTVYLRDISRFSDFNEVYKEYFKGDPPARAVIEVSNLPKGVDLEVEAIGYIARS